jgi:serine phosphatase RsbU (regulator of sigma subunit)
MIPVVQPQVSVKASIAALHSCETQDELELNFSEWLAAEIPDTDLVVTLSDDDGHNFARIVLGHTFSARPNQKVSTEQWGVASEQVYPIKFRQCILGECIVGKSLDQHKGAVLSDALTHLATALVNLTLNAEAREAIHEYGATLQALKEGIVLFQEPDGEALMARLLSLAGSMVEATAGALYVLEEVGNPKSRLDLKQTLGIPESLLESFRGEGGCAWPSVLLDWPAQVSSRAPDGNIAKLDPATTPSLLERLAVVPLCYHGVQAGICILFNPRVETARTAQGIDRLQSFGQLAAALLHRRSLELLREESFSIDCQLRIAETIQKRLAPSEAPPSQDYEFAWHSTAAKSIGGDYVDFLTAEGGDIHAVVADAAGHGINSALLMSSFRGNYRGNTAWLTPTELAHSLNTEVTHEVGPTGMFITAAMIRIEADTRRLSICSAGHNPALIYRAAAGDVEEVSSHGPPMGFMANADYEGYHGKLQANDVLLIYTDGVTEASNTDGDMFGDCRLKSLLRAHARDSAQGLLEAILQELAQHVGSPEHDDDVSLLIVKAN